MPLIMSERQAVTNVMRDEYRKAERKRKSQMLDEFCKLTGYNRNYASRKLRSKKETRSYKRVKTALQKPRGRKRRYGPECVGPLIQVWVVMDLACGKRVECSRELSDDNRIEAHERYYDAWFKRERGGVWMGRTDVIDEARVLFGYFALFTNDASLSPQEALGVYRSKDMVEKAFSDIKTRLDFRTPKVSTEETLDGKLLVVFISLIIISWLKQKMAESGLSERWTLQGLIDEIDTIERYERPGHKARILEVTKKQKEIFEALGIKVPGAS